MKKILNNYSEGISGWFTGYAISYYTYLSIVLSEIFYIWRFWPENSVVFTILLITNCVVIGSFCVLKRIAVLSKWERVVSKLYLVALAIVFVLGCFVDFWQNFVLYFVPLIFTAVWIFLRDIQIMRFATSDSKILITITLLFCNFLVWPLFTAFVSLTPFVILTYVCNLVFESRFLMIIIPFLFGMIIPFVTCFEELFIGENIFEIGYKVLFTKRVEDLLKELDISSEILWSRDFADAVFKLDEVSRNDFDNAWEEFVKEVKRIKSVLNESKDDN